MTEYNVATVVDRLLGDDADYLNESVTSAIADRVLGPATPRAVVVALEGVRSSVWGVRRWFATLGPVEVYA